MKIIKYLFLVAITSATIACGSKDSAVKDQARQSIQNQVQNPTPPPGLNDPIAGAGGAVKHYICTNNCEGSGGDAQANCPVCGQAYVHNAAFHNQPAANSNPAAPATPATPTSPAQNAAGVYHYTCSNGCEGGGAAAGPCGTCGATLVHNSAYHG